MKFTLTIALLTALASSVKVADGFSLLSDIVSIRLTGLCERSDDIRCGDNSIISQKENSELRVLQSDICNFIPFKFFAPKLTNLPRLNFRV